ncbi:hypothetical protein, partial [Xanthomonas vasicola]|uniref:hypothetical protein n=1 Tax=Xanthomonas vasicola TaxID=56459 RepID=UPI001F2A485C
SNVRPTRRLVRRVGSLSECLALGDLQAQVAMVSIKSSVAGMTDAGGCGCDPERRIADVSLR